MADDDLDPKVNVVTSDEDADRARKQFDEEDRREGAPPDTPSDAPPDYGAPGQIDRSRIRAELEQNPALATRLNQMVRGEVGPHASPEVRRIQMETAMNRALARGHSLKQALWDTGMAGNRGYYPPQTFTRGGHDEATFKGDLDAVLGGSNYAGKYGKGLITGNASADVARHQFQKGTPGFTVETGSGPESYFSEGPFRVAIPNNFPDVNARITDPVGLPNSTVHNLSEKEKDALNLRIAASDRPPASPEEQAKAARTKQVYDWLAEHDSMPPTAFMRAGHYIKTGDLSSAPPSANIELRGLSEARQAKTQRVVEKIRKEFVDSELARQIGVDDVGRNK